MKRIHIFIPNNFVNCSLLTLTNLLTVQYMGGLVGKTISCNQADPGSTLGIIIIIKIQLFKFDNTHSVNSMSEVK